MLDFVFGQYLMKYAHTDVIHTQDTTNKLGVVIIATKPIFWLPFIIKNIIDKIKKCNIYFLGSNDSIHLIRNILKIDTIKYISINDFNVIKTYNKYLLNNDFWNMFSEDYILVTQPDCILLRDLNINDYKFDYIGAACGNLNDDFVINGGLSLRKRSVMIDICNNLNEEEQSGNIPEDIVITKKIKQQYKCPTIEDCMNFSVESIGNVHNVLGIHGTDKFYIHPSIKNNFVCKYLY